MWRHRPSSATVKYCLVVLRRALERCVNLAASTKIDNAWRRVYSSDGSALVTRLTKRNHLVCSGRRMVLPVGGLPGFNHHSGRNNDGYISESSLVRRFWSGGALHAAHSDQAHQHRSQAHHHHGLRAERRRSEALDRAGRDFRQGSRDAGEPGEPAGTAPLGRRPPHRPGVEHRLLRNRAVVPRPGRPLRQHVGGALGSLRRSRQQAPYRANPLLAPHESAADDLQVERARADGGDRTRSEPRPDQPFHQARAPGHRAARARGQEIQRGAGGEDRSPRQGAELQPPGPPTRRQGHSLQRARHADHRSAQTGERVRQYLERRGLPRRGDDHRRDGLGHP